MLLLLLFRQVQDALYSGVLIFATSTLHIFTIFRFWWLFKRAVYVSNLPFLFFPKTYYGSYYFDLFFLWVHIFTGIPPMVTAMNSCHLALGMSYWSGLWCCVSQRITSWDSQLGFVSKAIYHLRNATAICPILIYHYLTHEYSLSPKGRGCMLSFLLPVPST